MIQYPVLKDRYTIAMTASSSGLEDDMLHYVDELKEKFEQEHRLIIGDTSLTQYKAKSADAVIRADELNGFLQDEDVDIIIPPFGGELAIEILDKIDYENIQNKWMLGYSDTSIVLLAITLKTGIATAHGTNLLDLRGKYSDETTKMWETVLKTGKGDSVTQYSSEQFQSNWDHYNATDYVFNFDSPTQWKSIGEERASIEGRLLGGCIDVIHHLVGTPYGDVKAFRENHILGEPVIWYLENCDSPPVDFRRMLVQMKYAGWFENCNGILFGRTPINTDSEGYTIEDVYQDIANELEIPIIYDIDCGHMPPQMTFINGAYAEVEYENGKGKVTQKFI